MRFSLYLILIFTLLSCRKVKNDFTQIIGHAGNGLSITSSTYSPNSLAAINYSLSMNGCEGVEIDVQFSSDLIPFMFHNEVLEDATNGEGCVNSNTADELDLIHYSTLNKEKLSRLSALGFSDSKSYFLDLKLYNKCEMSSVSIQNVINSLTLLNLHQKTNIFLQTNNSNWIVPLKDAGFQVIFVTSSTNINEDEVDLIDLTGICIKYADASLEAIDYWKSLGKKVCIYEIRSPKSISRALKLFPDIVEVDDVKTAINIKK